MNVPTFVVASAYATTFLGGNLHPFKSNYDNSAISWYRDYYLHDNFQTLYIIAATFFTYVLFL